MIAIHEYDSDSQFLCTVLTLNSLEALYVDVWRAADLGIPFCCGGTSSASVSSTETFEVATCILLTRPQWSSSCTSFDQLRFGAEWTYPTYAKVSKVKLNCWLLQLQPTVNYSTTDRPTYEHQSKQGWRHELTWGTWEWYRPVSVEGPGHSRILYPADWCILMHVAHVVYWWVHAVLACFQRQSVESVVRHWICPGNCLRRSWTWAWWFPQRS